MLSNNCCTVYIEDIICTVFNLNSAITKTATFCDICFIVHDLYDPEAITAYSFAQTLDRLTSQAFYQSSLRLLADVLV